MIKRLVLVISLILLPAAALADSSIQLGPTSSDAQTSNGSADNTGTILQPNDNQQLQSNGNSVTTLGAPDTNNLQQTPQGTSNLQALLQANADNGTQTLPSSPPTTAILALFLTLALVGMMTWHYSHLWWLRQKHRIPD